MTDIEKLKTELLLVQIDKAFFHLKQCGFQLVDKVRRKPKPKEMQIDNPQDREANMLWDLYYTPRDKHRKYWF